jgi:hypothetical protein
MKPMHHAERSATGSSPQPDFATVASIIAKGPPPDWLVSTLELWAKAVTNIEITPATYRLYKRRLRQMQEAVDTLIELFPLFNRNFEDLVSAQAPVEPWFEEDLPQLRDWLAEIGRNDKGRRPHFGRELCADIVVHFWKRVHGKAEPRSDKCYLACEQYWRVCGGEPSTDILNWRRMVEDASTRDELFLTHNMLVGIVGGTELKAK